MPTKLLLTSFTTWLPHQRSNASDDLLEEIAQLHLDDPAFVFLRQLPVDVSQASHQAIATIEQLQPDGIICCGMAESRPNLTVESCARCGDSLLKTLVDLEQLVTGSAGTTISHDAGKFVCEGLYYEVLKDLQARNLNRSCIFVHVPVLTPANRSSILADFQLIIQKLVATVETRHGASGT